MKKFYFDVTVLETRNAWLEVPDEITTKEEAEEYVRNHYDEVEWSDDFDILDADYRFYRSELVDE